jgi:RNA polymerase sigma-70 factor (ECF subfamily)
MDGENLSGALPVVASGDTGERLAFLFDAHYDRLYRFARRLTNSADDALDLVQETFLRAAKSVESIPFGSKPEEAWLVRVLVNIRRDAWRKSAVRDRHKKAQLRGAGREIDDGDPEEPLIARTVVWQALDILSPRRRAIVVMHELEGLEIPSIASLLGIRAVTVRWHLLIGRRELRRVLGSYLGGSR